MGYTSLPTMYWFVLTIDHFTYQSAMYTNLDDMLELLAEVIKYTDDHAVVNMYSDVLYGKCRDEV